MTTPAIALAALLTLAPFFASAFFPDRFSKLWHLPALPRLLAPSLLAIPYLLVATSTRTFHWQSLLLYTLLPVAIAALLLRARRQDPTQRGTWRDFFVLATVGLAVDLRWFEPACFELSHFTKRAAHFNRRYVLLATIAGVFYGRAWRQDRRVAASAITHAGSVPAASLSGPSFKEDRTISKACPPRTAVAS
jgi:hypothetical protein